MKALYILLILTFISCSSQKEIKSLPFPTEEVYFQKWIGGQQQTGGGTDFYIRFKEPFLSNIRLKKVYFQGKESDLKRREELIYYANFYERPNDPNSILEDDASNEQRKKAHEAIKPKFDLKNNEAVLEFEQDNKIQHYKISNIKENELLAYPSARPRN